MTTKASEVVLAPCPFCGGQAKTEYVRDGRQVRCQTQKCFGAGPPQFHGPADLPSAERRAIAAWNLRASPQPAGVTEEPSPTDTRERVLEEAARVADDELSDNSETSDYGDGYRDACQNLAAAIRSLKSKPTEAPVEDGWVRVPKEEFGRLFATAHELTAYHIVTPETPDNELVHVCNGDLRKLDERVTAFALAASTKEE